MMSCDLYMCTLHRLDTEAKGSMQYSNPYRTQARRTKMLSAWIPLAELCLTDLDHSNCRYTEAVFKTIFTTSITHGEYLHVSIRFISMVSTASRDLS